MDISGIACTEHGPSTIRTAYPIDLFTQFYSFAFQKISEVGPKLKSPTYNEMFAEIKGYINEAVNRRLRKELSDEETTKIIEGERIEVSKKIAKNIGETLDKAIYKLFKELHKTP
jgi:hypothetical protein